MGTRRRNPTPRPPAAGSDQWRRRRLKAARGVGWTETGLVDRPVRTTLSSTTTCLSTPGLKKTGPLTSSSSGITSQALFNINRLCGRPPQYAPGPVTLTFDLESGIRVTCDVGYLSANFSLPRPLCSRLRPDVRDRQTDVRQHHRLMPQPREGGGIITT